MEKKESQYIRKDKVNLHLVFFLTPEGRNLWKSWEVLALFDGNKESIIRNLHDLSSL